MRFVQGILSAFCLVGACYFAVSNIVEVAIRISFVFGFIIAAVIMLQFAVYPLAGINRHGSRMSEKECRLAFLNEIRARAINRLLHL